MPNFYILAIAVIIGSLLLHQSGKRNEQKSLEELAQMENPPQHAIINNQPSGFTWFVCIIIAIIAAAVAMPR